MNWIRNGIVTVSGQQFWRVDNLGKQRFGIEMLQKPSMLLLVEDFPDDAVDRYIDSMNAADAMVEK